MAVKLRQGEGQESLLKRFRKEVMKARTLSKYRQNRWFVSKRELERKAKQKAVRKARQQAKRATRF